MNTGYTALAPESAGELKLPLSDNETDMDYWHELIRAYNIRPLSKEGYFWTGIYLVIVGTTATVGNALVILTLCRNRKLRRKPHNQLLFNLAISDIGISIFGYPLTTASSFAGRYLFGRVGCLIQGFTCFTLAQANINTLAFLSVYRYVSVCYPEHSYYLNFVTRKVIVCLWVYALMWTLPPLMGWSSYTFEPFGTSCSVDWASKDKGSIAYTWCLIVYCYTIHIVLMAFCYYKIVKKAWSVRVNLTTTVIAGLRLSEGAFLHKMRRERRVTMIALAITTSFILLWSPYTLVSLWSVYSNNLPVWVMTLPTMFAKASCMINPLLYYFTNPSFRRNITILFARGNLGPNIGRRPLYMYRVDTTKDDIYIGRQMLNRRYESIMF
ncbi:rhodopsin, G0-coupled-like [Haliotis rufescens]|uniref:rhodopsin, G0-coupled-like n=1 Tax=Haliotis rufescens TaxID=6454 RepID=UPI00201F29F2|nr:rhodopsin, G0-coupled-like [Haliotis rufescens]